MPTAKVIGATSGRGAGRWISPDRLQPSLPALEDAQLAHAQPVQQLDRLLVAVPELVGDVGVAGQGDRAPPPPAGPPACWGRSRGGGGGGASRDRAPGPPAPPPQRSSWGGG